MVEEYNKVILLGTLGFDPDCRTIANGQRVANLRVVTNESYFDHTTNQHKETAEWHRVVVWGKQAEAIEKHLSKGRQVYVEGRLRSRKWEKDGQKRSSTDIMAHRIVFLGGKAKRRPRAAKRSTA